MRWEALCRCFSYARPPYGHNFTEICLKDVLFWKYEQEMSFVLPFLEVSKNIIVLF